MKKQIKRKLNDREKVIIQMNTLFPNITIFAIENYNINTGNILDDIQVAINGKY
jgi:predicted lysophospholipase L1 biosynthesis ABC-type transport system permease subunit